MSTFCKVCTLFPSQVCSCNPPWMLETSSFVYAVLLAAGSTCGNRTSGCSTKVKSRTRSQKPASMSGLRSSPSPFADGSTDGTGKSSIFERVIGMLCCRQNVLTVSTISNGTKNKILAHALPFCDENDPVYTKPELPLFSRVYICC